MREQKCEILLGRFVGPTGNEFQFADAVRGIGGKFCFPCCDGRLMDEAYDENNPPLKFIYNGCQEVPERIRYGDDNYYQLNKYCLVEAYRKLLPEKGK